MCLHVYVRMHACKWLEDSVSLVRMLDCPFAGSVATVVFPWRHCHLYIAALKTQHQSMCL